MWNKILSGAPSVLLVGVILVLLVGIVLGGAVIGIIGISHLR